MGPLCHCCAQQWRVDFLTLNILNYCNKHNILWNKQYEPLYYTMKRLLFRWTDFLRRNYL